MATFAATLGTLGALWTVSQLVDRETKLRRESFTTAKKTLETDNPLASVLPKPSTDTAELQKIPKTTAAGNGAVDVLPSYRASDEFLFQGNDPIFPGGERQYYRTKQPQLWMAKQEHEQLPFSTIGNVKQTSSVLANQTILDRNPLTRKNGVIGVGSATGVETPGRIWEIEAVNMGRDDVKNTAMFTPNVKRKNDSFMNTRAFIKPAYDFAPILRKAPTFLAPRWFDKDDSKINRSQKTSADGPSFVFSKQNMECMTKHDRTSTDVGVMYKALPTKTAKVVGSSAVELLVDDKEDHVLPGRNPGVTATTSKPRFPDPVTASNTRRKLDTINNRSMCVPHVPKGTYAQPNSASQLFTVLRKKRTDLKGPVPNVGNTTLTTPQGHPAIINPSRKSTKSTQQLATANPHQTAPPYIGDKHTKPFAKGVSDTQGNRDKNAL